jgi:hypothetical protein
MFGVAAAAGVDAAAVLAVVSEGWASGLAHPANTSNAAIPAADTTKGLLERRLIETELLI